MLDGGNRRRGPISDLASPEPGQDGSLTLPPGKGSMAKEACNFKNLTSPGVRCPACKRGELDPTRGRFGPIYKCTKKACGFWVDSRPIGRRCRHKRNGKLCGALMVEGTKTIPNRCSDRSCPNRHPHKLHKI